MIIKKEKRTFANLFSNIKDIGDFFIIPVSVYRIIRVWLNQVNFKKLWQ